MPDILNMSLLKSPLNWFLVAFSMAVLAIACHCIWKKDK